MAKVAFEYGRVNPNVTVMDSNTVETEVVTSTGTSAPAGGTTQTCEYPIRGACEVTANGGDVWVTFGTGTVTATVGGKHFVLDGQTRSFMLEQGEKGAVINDA